jgi:hypothetical protein|tara:strand:+ start:926 stop:1210 length:285 start_codon:yes stop_codon:yes gene_type:complete
MTCAGENMASIKKLTPSLLKRLVLEEKAKIEKSLSEKVKEIKAKEVKASDFAQTLEKKIDYAKALKVEEVKVRYRLKKIVERRKMLARKILKDI